MSNVECSDCGEFTLDKCPTCNKTPLCAKCRADNGECEACDGDDADDFDDLDDDDDGDDDDN